MVREFNFPLYDLDQAIEVARKITDRGAGATLSQPELAAFLGYKSVNNGAFITRIAAARQYGLIEGSKAAYRVTPLAVAIIHPDYPETAARARRDAFRNIPLFAAYLDAFRGRPLPDEQGAINALVTRFKVPQEQARAVLGRLMKAADQAGLFRVGGQDRMIEPTFTPRQEPPESTSSDSEPQPMSTYSIPVADAWAGRRFPKIIEATLDLMPAGPPWDGDEFVEWMRFFDQACRVYYRIPKEVKTMT